MQTERDLGFRFVPLRVGYAFSDVTRGLEQFRVMEEAKPAGSGAGVVGASGE